LSLYTTEVTLDSLSGALVRGDANTLRTSATRGLLNLRSFLGHLARDLARSLMRDLMRDLTRDLTRVSARSLLGRFTRMRTRSLGRFSRNSHFFYTIKIKKNFFLIISILFTKNVKNNIKLIKNYYFFTFFYKLI